MLNRKGQNIAEYSILIALVIAAAVAMQVYVKRGIQGRVADAVDHAPEITDFAEKGTTLNFKTRQYEPYYVDSNAAVASTRGLTENITNNVMITRNNIVETTTRAANAYEKTTWNGQTAR